MTDYETRYRDFIAAQWPEVWTSYRQFETTRVVYNHLTRYHALDTIKDMAQRFCEFLHPQLCHEDVVATIKELLSGCGSFFSAMTEQEQQAIVLEMVFAAALQLTVVFASMLYFRVVSH